APRLPPQRVLNDWVLLLHGSPHGFFQICRRALILLRCFALEHVHLRFFPAFTAERPTLSSRDRARADAERFSPRRIRFRAILCTEPCHGFHFLTLRA